MEDGAVGSCHGQGYSYSLTLTPLVIDGMITKLRLLLAGKRFSRPPVLRAGRSSSAPRSPTVFELPISGGYAVLLAVALLFSQVVLIVHQIDHQAHVSKSACDLCLTAQHLGSTPVSKDTPPAIIHGAQGMDLVAAARPLSTQIIPYFFARAPPFSRHV